VLNFSHVVPRNRRWCFRQVMVSLEMEAHPTNPAVVFRQFVVTSPVACKCHPPSEDSGGGLAASCGGFPRARKQHGSSKDGGGAHAASAGLVRRCAGSDEGGGVLATSLVPLVMDLGSGVGDGPVRTAVGLSSPHPGVPRPSRRVCAERGWRWWCRRLVVQFPWRSQTTWVQRGRRWYSRHLCWPMAAAAGFVRGCAGSDSGGGYLAASRSASS